MTTPLPSEGIARFSPNGVIRSRCYSISAMPGGNWTQPGRAILSYERALQLAPGNQALLPSNCRKYSEGGGVHL